MKYTESTWIPEKGLLATRLGGSVNLEDIKCWERSLEESTAKIAPGSSFKAFINLHGFMAEDIEAHKAMRTVVPIMLGKYNFRTGYLALFEDAVLPLEKTNGITCIAVAHVHHDTEKIKLYSERFDKGKERFFTDQEEARQWIEAFDIYSKV